MCLESCSSTFLGKSSYSLDKHGNSDFAWQPKSFSSQRKPLGNHRHPRPPILPINLHPSPLLSPQLRSLLALLPSGFLPSPSSDLYSHVPYSICWCWINDPTALATRSHRGRIHWFLGPPDLCCMAALPPTSLCDHMLSCFTLTFLATLDSFVSSASCGCPLNGDDHQGPEWGLLDSGMWMPPPGLILV